MKRMLRWRIRRYIASVLVMAMTFPLGQGVFGTFLMPAAEAAPTRKQSVVVFDFVDKSKKAGPRVTADLTRQVRLAVDQSSSFDLVTFSPVKPHGAPIDRAVREGRIQEAELSTPVDLSNAQVAVKIANILGAQQALVGEIDEDGYIYDARAKRVTIKVTATMFSYDPASAELVPIPTSGVTATGVGEGEGMDTKARLDAAQKLEAKLAKRDVGNSNSSTPQAKRKTRIWPYVLGAAALGVLVASLGGKKSSSVAGPSALTVTPTGTGTRLTWAASGDPGTTGYRIYRSAVATRSGSFEYVAQVPAGTLQYDDVVQDPTMGYLYRVVAIVGDKESSPLESTNPVIPAKPRAVTNVQASLLDLRTIQVSWAANTEAYVVGYRVYRSEQSNTGFAPITAVLPKTSTTFEDAGLDGAKVYFYKVTAVGPNSLESDLPATSVTASTDVRPQAPRNVTATADTTARKITITWTAAPGADYYQVFRSVTRTATRSGAGGRRVSLWQKFPTQMGGRATNWQILPGAVNVVGTSYVDTAVDYDTTYSYMVRAIGAGGDSPDSEPASASINRTPDQVSGLTAVPGDSKVTLNWTANPNCQYLVYRREQGQTATGTLLTPTALNTTTYTDNTAVNNTTYEYTVTAVSAAGLEGPVSQPVAATPTTAPAAPSGVMAFGRATGVHLVWNASADPSIKEYRIYRDTQPTATPTLRTTVLAPAVSWEDANAPVGATYYYRVTAVNQSGVESAFSAQAFAKPDAVSTPAQPAFVQATGLDTKATIAWAPVTTFEGGAALTLPLKGYRIYRTDVATGVRTFIKEMLLVDLKGETTYEDKAAPLSTSITYGVSAVLVAPNNGGELESAIRESAPVLVMRRLAAPAGFTVLPINDGTAVSVSWNAIADATANGYRIFVAESAGGPFNQPASVKVDGVPVTTVPLGKTTAVLEGLEYGKAYYLRMLGVDKAGVEGMPTAVVSITLAPPVTNVAVDNRIGGGPLLDIGAVVTWTAPVGAVPDGYIVSRSLSATGPFQNVTAVSPTTTALSYTDWFEYGVGSLQDAIGASFFYRVTPVYTFNGVQVLGPGTVSASAKRIEDVAPGLVLNPTATLEAGAVVVRWDAPLNLRAPGASDIVRYDIYRRLAEDAPGMDEQLPSTDPDNLFVRDTTVEAGAEYIYTIVAVDNSNVGAGAATAPVTVPAP